jgi:hypothetical protein
VNTTAKGRSSNPDKWCRSPAACQSRLHYPKHDTCGDPYLSVAIRPTVDARSWLANVVVADVVAVLLQYLIVYKNRLGIRVEVCLLPTVVVILEAVLAVELMDKLECVVVIASAELLEKRVGLSQEVSNDMGLKVRAAERRLGPTYHRTVGLFDWRGAVVDDGEIGDQIVGWAIDGRENVASWCTRAGAEVTANDVGQRDGGKYRRDERRETHGDDLSVLTEF